jgi:hypothetical protein
LFARISPGWMAILAARRRLGEPADPGHLTKRSALSNNTIMDGCSPASHGLG